MSDRATVGVCDPELDDGQSVSEDTTGSVDAVVSAIEAAGGAVVRGTVSSLAETATDAMVTIGEPAVLAAGRHGVSTPVLPVASGRGIRSVPTQNVESAVESLLDDEYDVVQLPVLDVSVAGTGRTHAVTDVMLVTSEAAKISEYTVECGAETIAQFRADGIVVATPAGSRDYARSAGAPIVHPGGDVGPICPIAPFAIDVDHWMTPLDDVTLTVVRDETGVDLLVDDRTIGPVSPHDPVTLTVSHSFPVAVVPESDPWFQTT